MCEESYRVTNPKDGQWVDCVEEWYLKGPVKGIRHRLDGPAVTFKDGSQLWYLDGKSHRTDGPAEIWSDGYEVWYR